jgi:hypothetical protein
MSGIFGRHVRDRRATRADEIAVQFTRVTDGVVGTVTKPIEASPSAAISSSESKSAVPMSFMPVALRPVVLNCLTRLIDAGPPPTNANGHEIGSNHVGSLLPGKMKVVQ